MKKPRFSRGASRRRSAEAFCAFDAGNLVVTGALTDFTAASDVRTIADIWCARHRQRPVSERALREALSSHHGLRFGSHRHVPGWYGLRPSAWGARLLTRHRRVQSVALRAVTEDLNDTEVLAALRHDEA